jgi:hypothetical protein
VLGLAVGQAGREDVSHWPELLNIQPRITVDAGSGTSL